MLAVKGGTKTIHLSLRSRKVEPNLLFVICTFTYYSRYILTVDLDIILLSFCTYFVTTFKSGFGSTFSKGGKGG
jgi:hypothetical protein